MGMVVGSYTATSTSLDIPVDGMGNGVYIARVGTTLHKVLVR